METVPRVGDGVLGVSTVPVVAGEDGGRTEVLAPAAAPGTDAACRPQPGHAHTRADGEMLHPRAALDDGADNFVTEHERQPGIGQFTVEDVEVGAAHAARAHLEAHIIWSKRCGGEIRRV